MPEKFSTVVIFGKTQLAKDRVKRFGSIRLVKEIRERIDTLRHRGLAGPFMLTTNIEGKDLRWIAVKDDPDFDWVETNKHAIAAMRFIDENSN